MLPHRNASIAADSGSNGGIYSPPPSNQIIEKLGNRFITRRKDGNFWYVQIRVMVDGKRHAMSGKSFYDREYNGREAAYQAALKFRNENVLPFFKEVGYSTAEKPKKPPKIPKFRKRKEATSGIFANLHYIHLYKKDGKLNRCVIDVTVNIHGKPYHSISYSYMFDKYGGKESCLKIAKQDRNRLAQMVQQKALELNQSPERTPEETKSIIKAIKIKKTPPLVGIDLEKYIRRSNTGEYWIVAIRKKLWGKYYHVPNKRFYDESVGGKHKSKLEARKFAGIIDSVVDQAFKQMRDSRINNEESIRSRMKDAIQTYI